MSNARTTEAILLGTAQDGGLPQAGCWCPRCTKARSDPDQRRLVSCLGLVDHVSRQTWMIDATPDFREQLHILERTLPAYDLSGIILTHAHSGHYTGLVHLGREAWNTQQMPLYASRRMAVFLQTNAPWSQLMASGNVAYRELVSGEAAQISPRLHLVAHPVPHRDEFSDTLAIEVFGSTRRLFYCPDIDAWDRWDRDPRSFFASMDVALLDGTFFSENELPGRDLSEIPHPLVTDTAERLSGVACDVRLIHLNHSNPLHAPGPERDWLVGLGLGICVVEERWALG